MSVHHALKGYAENDKKYEALGRCTYLQAEIVKATKARNVALNDIERNHYASNEHDITRIRHIDVAKIRDAMNELERTDIELMALIEEYNKQAKSAGIAEIILIKPMGE